jgi:DNA-binding beta-propeller fold protein YncE
LLAVHQAPAPSGTVVVTNMNDNTATIIDLPSHRVLATLATGEGPHEVVISHDGRWATVSNYGVDGKPGSTLTVIDLERLTVDRTISLGRHQRPHGMAFLPGDTVVAVTSEVSAAVVLVDLRTSQVTGTIPTGGRTSHMLAMTADGTRIVISNIADGTVSELDVGRRAHLRTLEVAKLDEGIAISPDGRFVWSGSNGDSVVVVLDLKTGAAVDTVRGFGMPYRIAVTPDGQRMVVTDPIRSTVSMFDTPTHQRLWQLMIPSDSLAATAEVPGSASPEGVAVSRDSHFAFVTLQGRNRTITIDLGAGRIVGWAVTGVWSDGIAYSPIRH